MADNYYSEEFTRFRLLIEELNTTPDSVSKILAENNIDEKEVSTKATVLAERLIGKRHGSNAASAADLPQVISDEETLQLIKAEAFLVSDFIVAPTILEISRVSGLSPDKLKNYFKNLYGLPIYEYYQKNRMLNAKSLLLSHTYTIREVAQMVGYTNLWHFISAFKKEFEITPDEVQDHELSGRNNCEGRANQLP
jgi:AraC-like DNA-binding protein